MQPGFELETSAQGLAAPGVTGTHHLWHALPQALARGELSLAYQPQLCLASGRIVGAEALLRWHVPGVGEVAADRLVALAEQQGLMPAIGQWVLQQVCAQQVQWRAQRLPLLRVAVNLSPTQVRGGDLAASVQQALAATGCEANALTLEITETCVTAANAEQVSNTLRSLRASGVQVVLDDFGTGASSLRSLRTLPIDMVTIDRSFVADVTNAPESASVTRSIINLAHGLRIPVLAEGVETEGQLHMLAASGCDRIQGYLFSRPVPADELAAMLREGRGLAGHLAPRPSPQRTLLLVDDEPNILSALRRLFRGEGYQLLTAGSGPEALELLASQRVDVILSDQRMPGMSGVDFLRRARALHPHTVRMTLSGFTDLQSIIDAVNEGAVYKFLTKPWDDALLRGHVAQAFAHKELGDENRRLQGELASANGEQLALNRQLANLLGRQRLQAELLQAGAGHLRDLMDTLPVALFGLDTDGRLAFANQLAMDLLPEALTTLGGDPGPQLGALLVPLRLALANDPEHGGEGHAVVLAGRPCQAWWRPLSGALEALQAADQATPAHRPALLRGHLLVLLPLPAHA